MASKCRQNYHEDSEALVNQQINIELNSYNKYLAMVRVHLTILLYALTRTTCSCSCFVSNYYHRWLFTIVMNWP